MSIKTKSIVSGILALFFTVTVFADEPSIQKGDLFYSWIDDLRMRDDAGKVIAKLKEYEGVIYFGKHSVQKRRIVLRGKRYHSYNYLVKTNRGKAGWVYGGALKQVKGISRTHSEAVQLCHAMTVYDELNMKLRTQKQQVIDGTLLWEYVKSLQAGEIIYKKPRYKSACAGMLEEQCYSGKQVKIEYENGSSHILFGDFAPVLDIAKGTRKTAVLEKLGQPRKQNSSVFIYQSFYFFQQANYPVSIGYYISFFFDELDKVDVVKIDTRYHQDCKE